ncbi:Uncharacterized protein FKW44_004973, partial [Caligus rogercresseyi]
MEDCVFGFFLNAAGGVPLFIHMFAAFTPSHRCKVPACESQPGDEWMTWALPDSQGSSNFFRKTGSMTQCTPDNFSNETMLCSEWVYDKSDYQETIANQNIKKNYWELGHGRPHVWILSRWARWGLLWKENLRYSAISITTCLLFMILRSLILLMCTCLPIHWICAHSILVEAFGVDGREKCIAIKDTFAP